MDDVLVHGGAVGGDHALPAAHRLEKCLTDPFFETGGEIDVGAGCDLVLVGRRSGHVDVVIL